MRTSPHPIRLDFVARVHHAPLAGSMVIDPLPLIRLHAPVPTLGVLPASVAVVVSHKFWSDPASAVVGLAS